MTTELGGDPRLQKHFEADAALTAPGQRFEVVESAVFGIESVVYAQEVKAVVVVRPGAEVDEAELQEFCAAQLAPYKVPVEIELTEEALPRTASGKVMKHVLAGAANTQIEE